MKLKSQLAVAALTVVTLFAPLAAQAADASHSVQTIDLSSGSQGYSANFGKNLKNYTFSDAYNFTVTAGDLTALSSSISASATDVLALTGLWITKGASTVATGVQTQSGLTDEWKISSTSLEAGTYTLHVSGKLLTNLAASYSGNLNLVAVPEPETYAMLLGGLGLIGFAVRRKRSA